MWVEEDRRSYWIQHRAIRVLSFLRIPLEAYRAIDFLPDPTSLVDSMLAILKEESP